MKTVEAPKVAKVEEIKVEEVKEVPKVVEVIEEIKEPEPPREPVKGTVTVKYNHYKDKFPIVDGVLQEADIDE